MLNSRAAKPENTKLTGQIVILEEGGRARDHNADPANFADGFVGGNCFLGLINCMIGARPVSWSCLKTLYR